MLIGFHLLDRQIVDRDGQPVGKVDDVELTYDADGSLRVTALLLGQEVLGDRIGGLLGRCIAGTARRLSGEGGRPPQRIGMDLVAGITDAITLSVRRELLPDPPLEAWLRDHLISRIPGSDHEA
jgi:sporulation protein YlmC with PRC-barrel domain